MSLISTARSLKWQEIRVSPTFKIGVFADAAILEAIYTRTTVLQITSNDQIGLHHIGATIILILEGASRLNHTPLSRNNPPVPADYLQGCR